MSATTETRAATLRYMPEAMGYDALTEAVTAPILTLRVGRVWWTFFLVGLAGTGMMVVSMAWLFWQGIGIWGLNSSNIWGFAIINYVWWIGIGNAGTLISSMLLLTRQKWRASINRFAEAMTLMAAAIAGLYPILHLGRPWLAYWLMPYPNTMEVWPQWRSPLVWDFFAIASYIIFSALFWYTGLIPDLATLRDRAKSRGMKMVYGAFALGWTGSVRQWARMESFHRAMAAMAVPLVCSVHSVVGLDFAAGIAPGWAETIFPPYFVVGAAFSGFAMVMTLAIPIRWGFGLQNLVTLNHLDAIAKLLLFFATIMGISYATEWFMAWYAGDEAERHLVMEHFTGDYAGLYILMLLFNVLAPQLFWLRPARRSVWTLFFVAVLINVGMWFERILITVETPSRGFLPATWRLYVPTVWDWSLWIGSLCFFLTMFLIFVRVVPFISLHEVKELDWQRRKA